MIGWIIAIIIALVILLIIILKAKSNYSYVKASGAKSQGIGGFLKACCGRGEY